MNMRNSSNPPQQNWATPKWLFDWFDKRFHFDLDVCAEAHNAKCQKYYTEADNGLIQPWDGTVFANPPYGDIGPWIERTLVPGARGLLLLPARTDRVWFETALEHHEVWFLRGRIKFDAPPGFTGKVSSSGFPMLAVVFGLGTPGRVRFVDPRTEDA